MAGISLASGFNRTSANPLDLYEVVADNTARDAIASGVRYVGMKVYSVASVKTYQLQGGIANVNWVDISAATIGPFTAGSVIFSNGTIVTEDNTNFFWDNTLKRLGIGTNTPSAPLDVHSNTNPVIQSNYVGAQATTGGGIIQSVQDDGAAMVSGNRLGVVQFGGANDALHTLGIGAGISAYATENWSATAAGTKLVIATTPNGTTSRVTAVTVNQDQSTDLAVALKIASGGTNNGSLGVTAGGVIYTDGSKLMNVGAGTSGYFLQSNGASAPTWVAAPAAGGTSATKFIATNSGGQTISDTQTTGWVASQDTSSMLHAGGDYVTIPTTGYYWISATYSVDVPASQPVVGMWSKIYTDTGGGFSELARGNAWTVNTTYASAVSLGATVTRFCYLSASTKVAIWSEQNTGAARTSTGSWAYNHWSIMGTV